MRKKAICILSLILSIASTSLMSQTNYDKKWDNIDELIKKRLWTQAYEKSNEMQAKADKEKNSTALLISTKYKVDAMSAYQEECIEKAIAEYEGILPKLKGADISICHALLSKAYSALDVAMESEKQKKEEQLSKHRQLALQPTSTIQATSVENYKRICEKTGQYESSKKINLVLTPTVYDILIRNEIDFIEDPATRAKLYDDLLKFHANDDERIRIYIETEVALLQELTAAKSEVWKKLIDKYSSNRSEEACQLYAHYAQELYAEKKYEEAAAVCKDAAQKFEKCEGRADCENLLKLIYKKAIDVASNANSIAACNATNMIGITTTNIDTLYCWIAKIGNNKNIESIKEQDIVARWSQATPPHSLNQNVKSYCYMPALPGGHYLLILSDRAKDYQLQYTGWEFFCCNAQIVTANCNQQDLRKGYVIDRQSGKPIAGIALTLQEKVANNDMHEMTTTTDKNGYYSFDGKTGHNEKLMLTYDGIEISVSGYAPREPQEKEETKIELLPDRPVYRLGDTIRATAIVYEGYTNRPKLTANKTLYAELKDINQQIVTTDSATTDNYGRATFALTTKKESMPGYFTIYITDRKTINSSKSILLEEYKQPKFTISLTTETEENRIGDSIKICGAAISYTSTAISHAKVSYEIKRCDHHWQRSHNANIAYSGETLSDDNGLFAFDFVAVTPKEPLPENYWYLYQIAVTVTDITGETHTAEHSVSVTSNPISINIVNAEQCNQLDRIDYSYTNSDGKEINGIVELTIRPINPTATPKLQHPNTFEQAQHTISKNEFEERYPMYAYTAAKDTGDIVFRTIDTTKPNGKNSIIVPQLNDGVYVVEITGATKNNNKATATKTITVVGKQSKKLLNDNLLWTEPNKTECAVGDLLRVRIGSRHHDVTVYYCINRQKEVIERGVITLNDEIKEITLPITQELKGGFDINILAEKCCVVERQQQHIAVPYSEKKLIITYSTFRDKLTPGKKESWKINISKADGEKTDAAMIMTMYDAALESYSQLNWNVMPWHENRSVGNLWTREIEPLNHRHSWDWTPWSRWQNEKYVNYPSKTTYTIYSLPNIHGGYYDMKCSRMLCTSAMPNFAKEVDSEEVVYNEMQDEEVGMIDAIAPETAASGKAEGDGIDGSDNTAIRKKLESSGFFKPNLKCEQDGSITIQFSVPELITQWSIQSLAYNQELCIGKNTAKAITQKPIMIEPLVPRFVREGDEIDIKAKVTNQQAHAEKIRVSLTIEDVRNNTKWQDNKEIEIALPGEGRDVVCFHVKVPKQSGAARYTIVAQGEHHSDGEQNILPVLSNRELVAESASIYVNGRATKEYLLPDLRKGNRVPKLLMVEYTANPIWHAITTLPYMHERENPSNIYICNNLYTNILTQEILHANPAIKEVILNEKEKSHDSRLRQNSDIKQNTAENTPFLHDAEYEEERWDKMAEHFDEERTKQQIEEAITKLVRNQRDDGSWSWIAGDDHSSEYTTRYILRLLGNLSREEQAGLKDCIARAMRYVDNCAIKEYARLKKDKITNATDEDYLYIHSLYANKYLHNDAKEVYRYYINNSEKEYLTTEGIARRAELALILHRNGKSRKAKQILEQLEESSLYDNEMGRYWRDNVKRYFWGKEAIETQAYLICTFAEIAPEKKEFIAEMQQWLLKQKQTTIWNSDIATIEAIRALIYNSSRSTAIANDASNSSITYNSATIYCRDAVGYAYKKWEEDSIAKGEQTLTINQNINSIGWGAAYWQYEEEIAKIESSSTGLKLTKELLHKNSSGEWEKTDGKKIAIGEKIKVQIKIESDRNIEYLEMIESRAAGTEPVTSMSGWRWGYELSYYVAVKDNDTRYYIERLNKGRYMIEYELYATHSGVFDSGTTKIQGLYSPEFRAVARSQRIEIR